MLNSLYSKLALALFLLMLVIGAALLSVGSYATQLYQQEVTQKLNKQLAAHMVDAFPLITATQPNTLAIKALFHDLMIINPSIEVYLLDPLGRILTFSAPADHVRRQHIALGPIEDYLQSTQRYPLRGDDPRDVQGQKVFSAAEIRDQGVLQGYLYVILASEAHDSIASALGTSYALQLGALGLAICLVLALLAGLLLFSWLTQRLRQLSQRLSLSDTTCLSLPAGGDELDQLTDRFDQMHQQIRQQVTELESIDNRRREMVANVSHDLRTPLATLHGYLETLLIKDGELSADRRRQYLRTAVRNSENLAQLVEQLFELARLDAGDSAPQPEAFALEELIQDTLQKYRLSAQKKDITLQVECSPNLPFVLADIGLIQRALDNLIDNALRHTPPDGRITVILQTDNGKVDVAIRDTGCGIPASDLSRIFERFYRRDKSREAGPAHAGLGLAIAKRILELHGAVIRADSLQGEGTTFSFALPCPAQTPH